MLNLIPTTFFFLSENGKKLFDLQFEIVKFDKNIKTLESKTEQYRKTYQEYLFRNWSFVSEKDLKDVVVDIIEEDKKLILVSSTKYYSPWWLVDDPSVSHNSREPTRSQNLTEAEELEISQILNITSLPATLEPSLTRQILEAGFATQNGVSNNNVTTSVTSVTPDNSSLLAESVSASRLPSDVENMTENGSSMAHVLTVSDPLFLLDDLRDKPVDSSPNLTCNNILDVSSPSKVFDCDKSVHLDVISTSNALELLAIAESEDMSPADDKLNSLDLTFSLMAVRNFIDLALEHLKYIEEMKLKRNLIKEKFEEAVLSTLQEDLNLKAKGEIKKNARYVNILKRLSLNSKEKCENAISARKAYCSLVKEYNCSIRKKNCFSLKEDIKDVIRSIVDKDSLDFSKIEKLKEYGDTNDFRLSDLYREMLTSDNM